MFAMAQKVTEDEFARKYKSYSDQTGKFPHMSSRGNQYIFTMYDYDSNVILVQALKIRQGKEITEAFQACHSILPKHRHETKIHIIDIECSEHMRAAFIKSKIKYKLVPPRTHRRNAAEWAICTFKNHLSGLATLIQTI